MQQSYSADDICRRLKGYAYDRPSNSLILLTKIALGNGNAQASRESLMLLK